MLPSRRPRPAAIACALLLAGCADQRRAVLVTPMVPDDLGAPVGRYDLAVTLDGKAPAVAPPPLLPAQIPFTLVLPAGDGGALAVEVSAQAEDGEALAHGRGELALAGLEQSLTVPLAPAPALRLVTPPIGPLGGQIPLVLGGARLPDGAQVSVGGVDAGAVTRLSPTELQVTLPPRTGAAGPVPIVIAGPDGQRSERADLFSYYAIGLRLDASLPIAFPRQVLLGDVNGDRRPDLIVASATTPNLRVLLGKGDGTFGAPIDSSADSDIRDIGLGDINLDGKPDLILANGANRFVDVMLNADNGRFQAPLRLETQIAEAVAVGDLDGDGAADVVVANVVMGGVSLLLNKGGTLAGPQPLDTAASNVAVEIADLDGDKIPDLVLGRASFRADDGVAVMPGLGGGRFGAPRIFPMGAGAQDVQVADLDGDGRLDVVAAALGGTSISVLRGNGDGTLQAPRGYGIGMSSFRAALVDYNRDGHLDIAAPLFDPGSIAILINNGDGAFHLGLSLQTDRGPSSVGVGDLDGDGKPDLVLNHETDGKLSLLRNSTP